MVCENLFTAPPRLNGWTWCFQSSNRLHYNHLGESKSRRTSKSHYRFKSYGEASRWRVCYQQGLPRLVSKGEQNQMYEKPKEKKQLRKFFKYLFQVNLFKHRIANNSIDQTSIKMVVELYIFKIIQMYDITGEQIKSKAA